jgi:hypothetical protein
LNNQTIEQLVSQSYRTAGIDAAAWQPELGFRANTDILYRLYDYYQAIYFTNPQRFLWAGLARLTGGQLLYGMQNLIKVANDPCALTQGIVATAKDIFENMGWQHELFVGDRATLLQRCQQLDSDHPAVNTYVQCWQLAAADNHADIAMGNQLLLQNEQQSTIQPHYEAIKKDPYSARYFWFTRLVMRNIHPYHSRFIFCHPFGDVTQFDDRWRWISRSMWPRWCALPQTERDRLVALPIADVIRHRWGKGIIDNE